MYGCCKNNKIRSSCGRHCGLHDFDALYLLYSKWSRPPNEEPVSATSFVYVE